MRYDFLKIIIHIVSCLLPIMRLQILIFFLFDFILNRARNITVQDWRLKKAIDERKKEIG